MMPLKAVSQNKLVDVAYYQLPNRVLEKATMKHLKTELAVDLEHFIFLLAIKTSSTNNVPLTRVSLDMSCRNFSIEVRCNEGTCLILSYKNI